MYTMSSMVSMIRWLIAIQAVEVYAQSAPPGLKKEPVVLIEQKKESQ